MASADGRGRRMHRLLGLIATVAAAALLAGCGSLGDAKVAAIGSEDGSRMPAATVTQLQKSLDQAVGQLAAGSGGIAGVWAPWAGDWTSASGTDSRAKGASPMSEDSFFRIGSITKPLTCTVLLDLVAAHKVKLDDPVAKYLPRMVGLNGLTLGNLCQNTSGLADYWNSLSPQIVTNPTRTWDAVELVNSALGQSRAGAPGQKFAYSNAGFVLLGLALQVATGQSWQKLYGKYVTGPLGIDETTTLPTGTALPSPSPVGYAPSKDVVTGASNCRALVDDTQLSPTATQTAGGLVSTLADTASMIHAVAAGTLLTSSSLAQQQQKGAIISGAMPSWAQYGLGVEKMGPLVGHASVVPGFASAAYSDPASGLTVVVMVNDSSVNANYVRLLALQLASIASKAPADKGKSMPKIGLPWTAAQLGQVLPYEAGCHKKAGAPADAALAQIAQIAPQY
ncbi:MAG TPA: serine hydrolase domain-containing protein [Gryllotalpicola sp.]